MFQILLNGCNGLNGSFWTFQSIDHKILNSILFRLDYSLYIINYKIMSLNIVIVLKINFYHN